MKTISAYAMRRFSAAFVRLQLVSERSSSIVLQFIALLFCLPCLKLSHLAFKITYSLQQRELVRLGRECARLGGQDYSLEFDDFGPDKGSVSESAASRRYEHRTGHGRSGDVRSYPPGQQQEARS